MNTEAVTTNRAEAESGHRSPPVRVMIVGAQPLVLAGLRLVIESDPGLRVVAEAGGLAEAGAAEVECPDVILWYAAHAGPPAPDRVSELLARFRHARLILLGADETSPAQVVKSGALGLVGSEQSAATLLKAIRKVAQGEAWFDRATIGAVLGSLFDERTAVADPADAQIASLTRREREVVAAVTQGLRNKQVAGQLGLSEVTVRHHLTAIFNKLGVRDRLELMLFAMRHNLTADPAAPRPVADRGAADAARRHAGRHVT